MSEKPKRRYNSTFRKGGPKLTLLETFGDAVAHAVPPGTRPKTQLRLVPDWRKKDRRDLLVSRMALRRGEGFFRCTLPRVEDVLYRKVHPGACGGLVFQHQVKEHLAFHGVKTSTPAKYFVVVPPRDDDDGEF